MSPFKAVVSCKFPGCQEILKFPGYCKEHRKRLGYISDKWYYLYNNLEWKRYTKGYLNKHPYCVSCRDEGKGNRATVVDHIESHRGNIIKFWDPANHQGLCAHHHSKKTAKEVRLGEER